MIGTRITIDTKPAAINQITYAFGPGVIGLLHDLSGSYALPFYGCIGLELIAAAAIMTKGK